MLVNPAVNIPQALEKGVVRALTIRQTAVQTAYGLSCLRAGIEWELLHQARQWEVVHIRTHA